MERPSIGNLNFNLIFPRRLEDYEAIEPLLEEIFRHLPDYSETEDEWKSKVKILNLGCGNSILAEEMYDRGFKNIYNIDISPIVIESMAKRNGINRPELKCKKVEYNLLIRGGNGCQKYELPD